MSEHEDLGQVKYRREADQCGFARVSHLISLDPEISDAAYRTYAVILSYAWQDPNTYVGLKRLADDRGKHEVTVSRHLTELADRGLITRQRRVGTSSLTWIEDINKVYEDSPVLTKMLNRLNKNAKSVLTKTLRNEEAVKEETDKKNFVSKSQKPKQPAKDHLDLAAITEEKRRQRESPIKYLESIALAALGMKKAPNYRYDTLWFEPLTDILDQAEGDIDRAGEAIRAAAAAAAEDALTITSPRSLHGLALQELAERGNGQTPHQSMDALPNAAEDPAYLAWLASQKEKA